MLVLEAKIRKKFGKKTKILRREGKIPAILYGEGIKNNIPLEVEEKEFKDVYHQAGESSLIVLEIKEKNAQKFRVLIYDIKKDPLEEKFLHIDFYSPSSQKQIETEIPLVFEGEPLAVKNLGGVLVKEIQKVEVKGLVQDLPREIKVDTSSLKTFDDKILIKHLKVPKKITILREPNEIVALVVPPQEEIEEVEKVKEAEEQLSEKERKLTFQENKIDEKEKKENNF